MIYLDLSQNAYRRLFWCFLFAVTLMRMMLSSSFGLGVDESHYVMYARHPAWGRPEQGRVGQPGLPDARGGNAVARPLPLRVVP